MKWDKLLNANRYGIEGSAVTNQAESRTEFQRDYDRLIFSSPFRRLQGKTQVFPLPSRVFVHNRLTHSLEVASVGRSLGNIISKQIKEKEGFDSLHPINDLGAIITAACLSHDLGNPPFGHSGEKAISHYFRKGNGQMLQDKMTENQWLDITNFEGNANVLRILTHQFNGRRKGGFNLTYATIASLIKYPWSSEYANINNRSKYGYFCQEKDSFLKIVEEVGLTKMNSAPIAYCRHPLVYLVEAADDISYQIMDLEDAHKLGIISTEDTKEILFKFIGYEDENNSKLKRKIVDTFNIVTDTNEQISYLRALSINKLASEVATIFMSKYNEIMNGTSIHSLVKYLSNDLKQALEHCSSYSVKNIYNHNSVIEIEIAGYNIINTLLDEFIGAIFSPDNHYSKKLLQFLPMQFTVHSTDTYMKVFSILDFLSGMTDTFAFDLYKNIKGIKVF